MQLYTNDQFKNRMLGNGKNILRFVLCTVLIFALGACTSLQIGHYPLPTKDMVAKSENVTFALVQILNRGEVYEARPEEFKKTEEWLEKAIKGGGFPNAKLSKDGNGQGIHIKVKIDVYNPPWYVLVLSTVNATATIGSLGLVPTYSGRFQHIFYFEVEQPNKSSQTYKVEGPFLAAWWGWLAPLFGNAGGVETQIVESWKLIVQRVAPQIEIKNK